MPEHKIRDKLFKRSRFSMIPNKTLYVYTPVVLFLGDDITRFMKANKQYGGDKELVKEIWQSRIKYFQDEAVKVFKIINEPENAWRYKNPGGQNFGKFNPIITKPKEWYGESYIPFKIGIESNRYSAFYESWIKNEYMISLPKELFNILCFWWLVAETNDAKNFLYNI